MRHDCNLKRCGSPRRLTGRCRLHLTLGLETMVSGLPAGSACHITKTSKGTREVEEFEYTMECDDQVPAGEELEAKSEVEPTPAG